MTKRVATYDPAKPMSPKFGDPAQGRGPIVKGPSSVRAIPQKSGVAIIAGAGRDVAKQYDAVHSTKKPAGPNEQNWMRG